MHNLSDSATVCVNVDNSNHPPVGTNDNTSSNGTPTTICVLSNDNEPDADALHICGYTQPNTGGTVTQNGNCLVFTPAPGYEGNVCFTYNVCDEENLSDTATVCLNVDIPNHPPVAINDNSLADLSQAVKLFEMLKQERSLSVKMERDGEEKEVRYQIR